MNASLPITNTIKASTLEYTKEPYENKSRLQLKELYKERFGKNPSRTCKKGDIQRILIQDDKKLNASVPITNIKASAIENTKEAYENKSCLQLKQLYKERFGKNPSRTCRKGDIQRILIEDDKNKAGVTATIATTEKNVSGGNKPATGGKENGKAPITLDSTNMSDDSDDLTDYALLELLESQCQEEGWYL